MNRFILALLLMLSVSTGFSQKVYFVYLQADSSQPFFVKMKDRVYSSTSSGYLILSKLVDSTYRFSIGFPQNKWPERQFSLTINRRDHGYLLKNFGDKGWGLYDLQTMAIQMPVQETGSTDSSSKSKNNKVSAFTEILSRAADDPSLKERPILASLDEKKADEKKVETIAQTVPKKVEETRVDEKKPEVITQPTAKIDDEKKVELITQQVKKDESKAVQPDSSTARRELAKLGTSEPVQEKKEETKMAVPAVYKQSVVTRKSESSTTEGFGLIFIDQFENGGSDTIRVLIPNPKVVVNENKEVAKEEKKFLDFSTDSTVDEKKKISEVKKETNQPVETKTVNSSGSKNNCAGIAMESDFFTLRKQMAAEIGDDKMVEEARKYFKAKCFSTIQLKNLSTLFLDDAGKYKFFDAAYPFVTDMENFRSLQSELKDQGFVNRFKALVSDK